jgi:hypothetical protein
MCTEAEIHTQVLIVFLLVVHSLEIYISSNSHNLFTVSVLEKGGKPERKPYPLPYGVRIPYRDLKSDNSQDYAQKPQ